MHVDHVAEAVIRCISEEGREGVVDVNTMRTWAGFAGSGLEGDPAMQQR
jgi:hypothetical protein